jgi:stage III sporulation protein SpoIIIAA
MTEFYEHDKGGPTYGSVASHGPLPSQATAWMGSDTNNGDAADEVVRDSGEHVVTDDLELLLSSLPPTIIDPLRAIGNRANLLEVVMDLGRKPEARYRDREHILSDAEVTQADINYVISRIGEFGGDNRAGIERTLHRISCIRNRRGMVVGLTCRIGRAVYGTISIIKDLVETGKSLLLVGPPGVGKTTLLRECARVLSDEVSKRVVVVDTSNEIAGDGDIPHPSIGRARRMQVPVPERQHAVMIEAVENHMPEVIIIDEIGTELEAQAARTIAERGVQLVGTAHGTSLENLMLNPTLSDLVGGIQTVTLGDEEARRRGTQKSVLERKAPPTFDIMVEILDRERVAVHRDVSEVVDSLLRGEIIPPEIRTRLADGSIHTEIVRTAPSRDRLRNDSGMGGGMGMRRDGGRRYDERQYGSGLPDAPRRQMPAASPQSPAMRRDRPESTRNRGENGGTPRPFDPARPPRAGVEPDGSDTEQGSIYDTRDPGEAQREERQRDQIRMGAAAMGIAAHASSQKPLRVYPFGVSRNRLEDAIKDLRVPATMVREMNDADVVMTLKNYYRKSAQTLRRAEADGVPVFVLKSNTMVQIQAALANVFDVTLPADPLTTAMEETEDAISEVMETARPKDLTPQSAHIRKIQHQMAERYNLQSVSKGKDPFRHVRIFRQD